MRTAQTWLLALALLGLAPAARTAEDGSAGPAAEKTLSPYFLVKGSGDHPEAFPLEATAVSARIAGVIADVTVRQTYRNAGNGPIEAIYVFPASTRAAVNGLRMTIGDRLVEAVIKEREQARRDYEQAKTEGKSASLLEQQRPNVFQMNVANILPGDRIEVELRYSELLVPEDGVYELVYPTVVGPRYSNRPQAGAPDTEKWVKSPYQRKDEPPLSRLTLDAELAAGLPVQDVASPSHQVKVSWPAPTRARVELDPVDANPGNRDFILRYRLEGAKVQTGLLLERAKDENFFLLMVQPPARVAATEVPPREFVFVLDVSGSMNGFPLQVGQKMMRGLLSRLRPIDSFDVVLFSGASALLSPASLAATPDNVAKAISWIDSARGGGGTELLQALDTALGLPQASQARSIVLLTDGYVSVETEAFQRIRERAGQASVYSFGIGSSVNRQLIEGLAHAGHGEPFVVTGPEHADAAVERFQRYIETPLLTDVAVDFGGLEAYDVEPASIPILTSERPLIVSGKWRGKPGGEIVVRGQRGREAWSARVPVGDELLRTPNPALRQLWARERLRVLSDFAGPGDAAREQIVELGLRYGLLTKHTSFVAVDQVVRNTTGQSDTVPQPLPLPQGVSELAVGTGAPATPEPGTLMLLGVAGAAAARHLRRRRDAR
jgi:Ca-activated chloride channel family protein